MQDPSLILREPPNGNAVLYSFWGLTNLTSDTPPYGKDGQPPGGDGRGANLTPLLLKNERKSNQRKIPLVDWGKFPTQRQRGQFCPRCLVPFFCGAAERKSALCGIAPIAPHLITLSSEVIFGIAAVSPNLGYAENQALPRTGEQKPNAHELERDLLYDLWDTFDPLFYPLAAFLPFTAIY